MRHVHDAEVEAVFAADGPLAELLPGYRPRRQQIDMSLQVARALHTPRRRLVVEAGTGTGKSFAYLVPALLSEGRIVVATGTRALQDQLVDKDAPLAVAAVAKLRGDRAGAKPQTVVRMKGRNNYLCKLRFEQFDRQQHLGFVDETLVQIQRFARETKTGDRAELKGLPDNLPVWADLDADKDHCLFQQCPVYDTCHVTEMRRAAEAASIVVVNHHLLCADQRVRLDSGAIGRGGFDDGADKGMVLPSFDGLIVDEAHALADVATDHFGLDTGTELFVRLLQDVRRHADGCSGDDRATLLDKCDDVEHSALALFSRIAGDRHGPRVDVRDADRNADRKEGGPVRSERTLFESTPEVAGLSKACGEALKSLAVTLDVASAKDLTDDPEEAMHKASLQAVMRRSERMRAELTFLTTAAPDDDRYVLFVDASPRATHITAAPIDVSSPLSGTLFAGDAPVVLTSATLAIGDDVKPFLFQVGLAADADDADAVADDDDDDDASVDEDSGVDADDDDADVVDEDIDVGIYPSPFDHKERAALYVPADMPEPNDAGWMKKFDDECVFLLTMAQGGAMLLFTSHRAMEDAYVRLGPALKAQGIPMFKQGERPKAVLLDELRSHGSAALFATASFWEGVDVRGAALRLVIIDRLPFRVPSDPLVRARGDHAKARGKDPFLDVAVNEAALALKQGVGRLLRTVDDAGVVAVLDGRLRRRSYGSRFLAALPPMTRVGAQKTLTQFWNRFVAPALSLPPSPLSLPSSPPQTSPPQTLPPTSSSPHSSQEKP